MSPQPFSTGENSGRLRTTHAIMIKGRSIDGTASPSRVSLLVFMGIALAVVTIWVTLLQSRTFSARHPVVGAWGATIDLVLTVPLAWYFILVRRRKAPLTTLVPVSILSFIAAYFVVPRSHHGLLEVFAGVAEIALFTFVIIRARRAIRAAEPIGQSAPMEIVREVVRGVIPGRMAAEAVVTELAVIEYALFSWKRRSDPGPREFVWEGAEDRSVLVFGMGIAILAETLGLHLWLQQSHPMIAWVITLTDLYAILWLIADMRALHLSGLRVTHRSIDLRFGFRWSVSIPIERVQSIELIQDDRRVGDLRCASTGIPDLLIRLDQPMVVDGFYGIRKRVGTIALRIGDRERFRSLVVGLGLWRDPEPPSDRDVPEESAVPGRADPPAFRMGYEQWLSTRPDYIPSEEWERHRPDWVEPEKPDR